MTAFLQRYVLENEFLRATLRETEKATSEVRARQLEDELVKSRSTMATRTFPAIRSQAARDLDSAPSLVSDQNLPCTMAVGGATMNETAGSPYALPTRPGENLDPRVPSQSVREGQIVGGDRSIQSTNLPPEQGWASRSDALHSTPTQAEIAIQRLRSRIEGNLSEEGSRDGVGKRRIGGLARPGEVRSSLGRVAELSSLLAETANERDSLAALLAMAEKRMERMTLAQEVLALKLAKGNALTCQLQQKAIYLHDNSVGDVTVGCEFAATALETANLKRSMSFKAENASPRIKMEIDDANGVSPPRIVPGDEVENAELRRRVFNLEALVSATEAAARKIQGENQRLRSHRRSTLSTSSPAVSFDATKQQASRDSPTLELGCRDPSRSDGNGSDYSYEFGFDDVGGRTDTTLLQFPCSSSPLEDTEGGIGARSGQAGCSLEARRPVGRKGADVSPHGDWRRRRLATSEQQMCSMIGEEDQSGHILPWAQLAWVLGLPAASTTEHELLAEVMHLVAERGSARTDASVLEAQLAEIDSQSLTLTRLAVGTAVTGSQALHGNNSNDHCVGAGNVSGSGYGCSMGAAESRKTPGGMTRRTSGALSGKISRNAQSNDGTIEAVTAPGITSPIRPAGDSGGGGSFRRNADRPNSADHSSPSVGISGGQTDHHRAKRARVPADVTTGPVVIKKGENQTKGRDIDRQPTVTTAPQDKAAVTTAARATVADNQPRMLADDRLVASGGIGMRPATAGNADSVGSVEGDDGDNPSRASFPRIFQGRPVSVDIFCTKVLRV